VYEERKPGTPETRGGKQRALPELLVQCLPIPHPVFFRVLDERRRFFSRAARRRVIVRG
jgi:hypothetical protein